MAYHFVKRLGVAYPLVKGLRCGLSLSEAVEARLII